MLYNVTWHMLYITVIKLSGVQFGLKSYAWFRNRTSTQHEFDLKSQVWFQTKIAWHEVQLPLYFIHLEITHFFKICIYWSTRLVRKKRNRKRVYMYVPCQQNKMTDVTLQKTHWSAKRLFVQMFTCKQF